MDRAAAVEDEPGTPRPDDLAVVDHGLLLHQVLVTPLDLEAVLISAGPAEPLRNLSDSSKPEAHSQPVTLPARLWFLLGTTH